MFLYRNSIKYRFDGITKLTKDDKNIILKLTDGLTEKLIQTIQL